AQQGAASGVALEEPPRVSVKMEAAAAPFFHPEEGLELLPGFVQLPGFVEGAPEEEEEEDEEELVAERKKGPFSAPSMRGPSGVVLQPPLLKLPPATDLEQLLIPSSPTAPSGNAPGGAFLYRAPAPPPPSSSSSAAQVTQEQEGFADGFVKALANLHKQNQLLGVPPPPPPPAPLSPAQPHPCCPPARQPEPPAIYTTLGGYNPG
ncbi:transcription factor AP-1-like, partial [Sceloporus undulatus]|uniref:transcription factor AP-1-like n=1 Tax=Sceloporus undulatus TaxID=8520 RepID=UPI001C4C2F9A